MHMYDRNICESGMNTPRAEEAEILDELGLK